MLQDTHYRRRDIVRLIAYMPVIVATRVQADPLPSVSVSKDPNCGCCTRWVEHLRTKGFAVSITETTEMRLVKSRAGVPADLYSCHTAEVAGYIVEGHVPADAIQRLLVERPHALGLAVPGMPVGSPGMEGGSPEQYDVILFAGDGRKVFGRYIGDRSV